MMVVEEVDAVITTGFDKENMAGPEGFSEYKYATRSGCARERG